MYGHRFSLCLLGAGIRYPRWAHDCHFGVVSVDHAEAGWRGLLGRGETTLSNADPSTQTLTMTVIDYKGYRIEVSPVGKGWRASIFSPGSNSPWPNSPVNLEKSSQDEIVAEAKRIVEMRLGPRLL
jgi:hypothetical protein